MVLILLGVLFHPVTRIANPWALQAELLPISRCKSKSIQFSSNRANTITSAEVWQFGATASATVTYTEGTSVSGTQNCPPNIICNLTASAELLYVVGNMTVHTCGGT